jgi:hypothetical protein
MYEYKTKRGCRRDSNQIRVGIKVRVGVRLGLVLRVRVSVTGYGLRVTGYGLRVTGYGLGFWL